LPNPTLDLSLFVAGSALFDSVSTSLQILVLVFLFSTRKPIRTSLGFILGVSLAYFACGLVGLALVDHLNALVKLFLPDLDAVPDRAYYQAELVVGVGLTLAGPAWELWRRRSGRPPLENRWIEVFKQMNLPVAFVVGALLSTTSFPAALPYVAALEKIAAAHLPGAGALTMVALYNLVYALPMLVPFLVFVVLREAVLPRLHLHAQNLNRWLTIALLSGMGLFTVADAAAFFRTGHALMATRFF